SSLCALCVSVVSPVFSSYLAGGSRLGHARGLADRLLAAELLPPTGLRRLLVVLVRPQLALHPAPLQELLEPPQGGPDRLPVVNPHPQTHYVSSEGCPAARRGVTERSRPPRRGPPAQTAGTASSAGGSYGSFTSWRKN